MNKEELKSKVLKDIQKSGFISEMMVNSILIKKGWLFTLCGETFNDKDLNKSREIDIVSYKVLANEDDSVRVGVHVVIEVKKSEKPWVVFCQKKEHFFHNLVTLVMLRDSENINMDELSFSDIGENYRHSKSNIYGSAYTEAFKGPSETSQIYSALITACKAATSYQKKESDASMKNNKKQINFYLPIVVLNGKLFQAKLDESGDVEIEETNYCPINLNYSSDNYSQERFFPEIVTIDEFESHLDHLIEWQKSIFDKICKNT